MATDETNAMQFVREASLGLPGSIKDVADYLLAEGAGIESQTMAQVASHTYVSKPTLVRFAKMAGYPGWTAFRRDYLLAAQKAELERMRLAEVDVNHPFGDGASSGEVMQSILRTQRLATDEVERGVDPRELEASARSILRAQNIAFLGAMHNRHRGEVFMSNLALLGVLCQVPAPDEAGPLAMCLDEGDCVVVASYSGDVRHPPLDLVPGLRKRGVVVVAITNSMPNSLSSFASHTLLFAPHEHLHEKIGAFYSGACTSMVLDLLYASCFSLRYAQSEARRKATLRDSSALVPRDFSSEPSS